ncbi:hypothetical protein M9H77_13396 [Catharanthus roseus]|uniref:Uncharacterized protein n=1 Tax=Catharanthus roseus TaxID=4058 RepID=A0ACC0BKB1_CATRO|nr:hypothetical protein M9H77_13396 [Catharanthus roseus]
MEGDQVNNKGADETLPPGFRFHPTDEELITYYLINKISDSSFTGRAVADVDLNKCEPWDLPGKAKMGEKEWYFFSLRDRKYPTGVRTNRATNTGYWKTTGKDKEIYNSVSSELVGMKKTLVFYRGRAPRGEKTNWVMHEYRIHAKSSYRTTKQDEWVVCRVFQKSAGGKKFPSSNHSRAAALLNANYNINIDHHHQINQNSISSSSSSHHHHHPNFQFNNIMGIRNYMMMNHADIQEQQLSSSSSRVLPIHHQSQMMNYAAHHMLATSGSGGGGGCFTISGLNLNLNGATTTTTTTTAQQQDVTNNINGVIGNNEEVVVGYGTADGEMMMMMNNNAMGNRFHVPPMPMDHSCADLDTYWPPY